MPDKPPPAWCTWDVGTAQDVADAVAAGSAPAHASLDGERASEYGIYLSWYGYYRDGDRPARSHDPLNGDD